jgi:hypothetical protein
LRLPFSLLLLTFLAACATRGKLDYVTSSGEHKTACETEYTWQPTVDKFAVEYVLSYCAKKAVKEGYRVVDKSLLKKELTIPISPNGKPWTFAYARRLHKHDKLSDKEYGYIIAFIDLGLTKE